MPALEKHMRFGCWREGEGGSGLALERTANPAPDEIEIEDVTDRDAPSRFFRGHGLSPPAEDASLKDRASWLTKRTVLYLVKLTGSMPHPATPARRLR